MKVEAVSFKSSNTANMPNSGYIRNDYNFLYNYKEKNNRHQKLAEIYKLSAWFLAAAAVGITLFKIWEKPQYTADIVNLADKSLGLNRIKNHRKAVNALKQKGLYPILSTIKGDKYFLKYGELKSGIVITGNTTQEAAKISEAFFEHAENLGIKVQKITSPAKNSKDNNVRLKEVYTAIKNAYKNFKQKSEYTIIDIGDLSLLTTLKASKCKNSNFDNFLKMVDQNNYPGVIWVAINEKTKSLPYFFNDLPVLMTKFTD